MEREGAMFIRMAGAATADAPLLFEADEIRDVRMMDLLRRKRYLDLSGNGLNHPNDFGHRLYAQVLLHLLI